MLVRCEHCGSVLPDDATKCFACGNKHQSFVPPPIPPEALDEIQRMREKILKRRRIRWSVMPWIILASLISLIVSFIVMSNDGTAESVRVSSIVVMSSLGVFILSILLWLVVDAFEDSTIKEKEAKIQVTQRLPKPDEAEYEQRIRDFVNQ